MTSHVVQSTEGHWSTFTPWSLYRDLPWVADYARRRHFPVTTTIRDGIRSYLRARLAQRQADAGLAHALRQPCPTSAAEFDVLLAEAEEVGLREDAYAHDPMPNGERPARTTKVDPMSNSKRAATYHPNDGPADAQATNQRELEELNAGPDPDDGEATGGGTEIPIAASRRATSREDTGSRTEADAAWFERERAIRAGEDEPPMTIRDI